MCAVPIVAVFYSSLTSWFPGLLLTYFLNYFEIVPVAPIITGLTFVFTFHMCCISVVRSLYFRVFSASFLVTFLSPVIATSINIRVPFSLSRIIISGLLGILLSFIFIIIIILYVDCTHSFFILCIEFHVACMQRKLCRICWPTKTYARMWGHYFLKIKRTILVTNLSSSFVFKIRFLKQINGPSNRTSVVTAFWCFMYPWDLGMFTLVNLCCLLCIKTLKMMERTLAR